MVYGELENELDEDEKSVLKLNPNMATYEMITTKGIRSDIEELFAKLRYSRLYDTGEQGESDDEVTLTEEEKSRFEFIDAMQDQVYCPESKTVDLSKRKVTDIKINKRILLPDPRPAREEAILMVMREY